jgi:hypothetical protein
MTHQFGQAPLPQRKLGLVDLFRQALRHVERTEHVQPVDARRERRRHRRVLVALVGQALLQRIEDRLADGKVAIAVVGTFDDDPRCPGRIRRTQQVAGNLLQLVVGLQAIPTRLGHSPLGQRVGFDRLQPLALRVLGKVDPELEYQRTLIDQHRFEAIELIHALVEIRARKTVGDPFGDRLRIPGTGKDPDPALRRQRPPVAPHRRTRALLGSRRVKRMRRHVARIHPLVEDIDGFALARPVDAADQDDHRKRTILAQLLLRFEQGRAQLGLFRLERFLVDLVSQFCRFKHQ